MMLEIFENFKELLKIPDPITVITKCDEDNDSILIQNYHKGIPFGDELYCSCVDFDYSILNFNYQKRVFVDVFVK